MVFFVFRSGFLTSFRDICDNPWAMVLRRLRKAGFVLLLLAAGGMLLSAGVWAAHDCCGHPSDTARASDGGTAPSSSDDDCVCPCCQGVTGISLLPGLSFHTGSWWPVDSSTALAVSRFETDIFRPPLA